MHISGHGNKESRWLLDDTHPVVSPRSGIFSQRTGVTNSWGVPHHAEIAWFKALLMRGGLGKPNCQCFVSLRFLSSDWIPMRSLSHDALEQPPYSPISSTSKSVVADRVDLCRLWAGHCKYLFIDFCIAF